MLMYTSGSTGKPKGVQQTHRNISTVVDATIDVWGVGEADRAVIDYRGTYTASVLPTGPVERFVAATGITTAVDIYGQTEQMGVAVRGGCLCVVARRIAAGNHPRSCCVALCDIHGGPILVPSTMGRLVYVDFTISSFA
ncbi:AMP-binding protein [Rhodococcus pseudokoreensis]